MTWKIVFSLEDKVIVVTGDTRCAGLFICKRPGTGGGNCCSEGGNEKVANERVHSKWRYCHCVNGGCNQ